MSQDATTIPQQLALSASTYGDAQAVSDNGVSLTFTELAASASLIGRALMAHGVEYRDRVAVWAPNSHHFVRTMLGIHMAGATMVPINTRYKGLEARELIQRTQAKAVLIDSSFLGFDYLGSLTNVEPDDDTGLEARRGLRVIIDVSPLAKATAADGDVPAVVPWAQLVEAGTTVSEEAGQDRAEMVKADDLLEVIFTSGTTGRSKGVRIENGSCLDLYRTYGDLWGLKQGDRYLISLPMFHAGGANAGVITCLIHGLTVVPMAVFDTVEMMKLIGKERITVLNGPPTVIFSLLDHPDRQSYELDSLRTAATGAASVPVAMVERVQQELPFEHFITAYGLTECYGTATMCRRDDPPELIASTNGRALPGISVRVVDRAGSDVPAGEQGEVIIQGANVMPGYWDTPELDRDAIRDGWLHTGDIGSLDEEGNLKLTDRLKDMLIVGGFNVSPAEIEGMLIRHPEIAEVSVIGVADERLGEVAMAYVIPRTGSTPTEAEIIDWARERMANFKVPRTIVFIDALPRTASGKVLKFELRAQAQSARA